jgi:hypothetical protein
MAFKRALPLWGLGPTRGLFPPLEIRESLRYTGLGGTPRDHARSQRLGGEDDLGRQAYGDMNELVIVMLPRA